MVAFVIAFAAQVVMDLPAVKSYVQEESDRARMEMYHLRVRYDQAERGMWWSGLCLSPGLRAIPSSQALPQAVDPFIEKKGNYQGWSLWPITRSLMWLNHLESTLLRPLLNIFPLMILKQPIVGCRRPHKYQGFQIIVMSYLNKGKSIWQGVPLLHFRKK